MDQGEPPEHPIEGLVTALLEHAGEEALRLAAALAERDPVEPGHEVGEQVLLEVLAHVLRREAQRRVGVSDPVRGLEDPVGQDDVGAVARAIQRVDRG